jgi:Spy/CpxP family protein refolding chaperone
MNKRIITTIVLVAIFINTATAVLAGHSQKDGCACPPPGMEIGPGGFEGRMAKDLKLTDEQQTRIKALLETEREQDKLLFDQMRESRKLLMLAAEAAFFDEAAVRVIAEAQARIETELIVSRTRVQSQINALLMLEQRELFKLLRPDTERLPPKGSEYLLPK